MAKTRSGAGIKREASQVPKTEQTVSECDSTVRQWGRWAPPARRQTRTRSNHTGEGVPWIDMPENALYTVFEALLEDKQATKPVSVGCKAIVLGA
jgi:hypothetical protein